MPQICIYLYCIFALFRVESHWDPERMVYMIGERIKEARLALGFSAEQVADFLGISPATVYRYENGDISKLPAKLIRPLAEYLCITPAYLMGWEEKDAGRENYALVMLENDYEQRLVMKYRSLSPRGQQLLLERAEELNLLYGKKSKGNSAQSV